MTKEYFKELAAYNYWADQKVITWLNQISEEQWNRTINSSFNSIENTAIHIVSAEKIWIDFWTNTPSPVFLSAEFEGSKDKLIEVWQKASAGLKNFIDAFPEEDLSKPVSFSYPKGGTAQLEYQQTFAHIVNHSTYHRGQLVTLLRQAGFTQLSSIDLATYYVLHCARLTTEFLN